LGVLTLHAGEMQTASPRGDIAAMARLSPFIINTSSTAKSDKAPVQRLDRVAHSPRKPRARASQL
jgi:hypothetical protein